MRFALIQITGLLLLVGAYLAGILQVVYQWDSPGIHLYTAAVITLLALVALGMASVRRWEGAVWLTEKLPVVGLLGTVLGVLWAVNGVDMSNMDNVRSEVFLGTVKSLSSNFLGMFWFGWAALTIRMCKDVSQED